MSYTNNWTQVIRQLMIESHTKEELLKLSNAELKKLHGEYSGKDDEKSQDEAKVIKGILDERGDEEEEIQEPKTVKEQNEELLMILDVLCEMIGVDMETLIEQTGQMSRKDWQNFLRGAELDKPAPEGRAAADARLAGVIANMKSLGKRKTRDTIRSGPRTAAQIEGPGEGSGKVNVHEPTAAARLSGAPSVTYDPKASARMQRDIMKIGDKVSEKAMGEIANKIIKKSKGKK